MVRQIKWLTGIQLCNLFGINEMRFTKDRKKKIKAYGLGIIMAFVILCFQFYVGGYAYVLTTVGMVELIPTMLAAVISLVILFFTFFKAGSVIFQKKAFELQMSLPVKKAAIVISRFLTMYVTNLAISVLVFLPGLGVYVWYKRPGVLFFPYAVVGLVILPLLPLTVATALGALIQAVSAKWKHKNLINIILTLLVIVAILIGSVLVPGNAEATETDSFVELQMMLTDITGVLKEQIGAMYPPAVWFGDALTQESGSNILLLTAVSLVVFVLFVAVLQKYFLRISTALNATFTGETFRMKGMGKNSLLKSLWKRELRRYAASPIYVTNTLVGYIMMVIASAAILIAGPEQLDKILGIPGAQKIGAAIFPFILGAMAALMPMSSCSVSMEGKQWWMMQTLPVPERALYMAKFLTNLTVAFPFYLVSVVLAVIAFRPTGAEAVEFVLIPALYIAGSAAVGLLVNRKIPVFDWDSEVRVVKQSASTFFSMLIGILSALIPIGLIILNFVKQRIS